MSAPPPGSAPYGYPAADSAPYGHPAAAYGQYGYPPSGYPPAGYGPAARAIPRDIGRGGGPVPLRPLSIGDLLDGVFKLLSATARPTLLITTLFVVPIQLLAAYLQRGVFAIGFANIINDPAAANQVLAGQSGAGANLALLLSTLATGFVLPIVAGAVCRLVGAAYLGQPLTWRQALGVAGRRSGALIGSWWLHVLAYAVLALPAILVVIVATATNPVLGLLGLLLGLLAGAAALFVMPLFAPTAPAIVTEGLGPYQGLRRAIRLVRGRYWPTVGSVLLTSVITYFIAAILASIPSVIALFIGGRYAWLLAAAGGTISSLVTVPLAAIAATLIYYDLRIRNEGFDLQLLASQLGMPAPSAATAGAPPWPGPGGPVPAWPGPGGAPGTPSRPWPPQMGGWNAEPAAPPYGGWPSSARPPEDPTGGWGPATAPGRGAAAATGDGATPGGWPDAPGRGGDGTG